MVMVDIKKLDIIGALELLNSGEISSVDLTKVLIEVIKAEDNKYNSYLTVDEEYALAQAAEADAKRAAGEKAKLLGVPLAIKDVLNVEDQVCTCGSKMLEGYISPYDATAIAKLRAAGAVFLGRTNMDEFAMGSTTENSAYKITKNPLNTDYVPGGSSGGSAAAVGAGLAIAALGTDTGGSIRQPACFCGCVGLKPSYGRISRFGLTAYCSSFDQIGPMTKTVRDSALLLEVMAGVDEYDSSSAPVEVPEYTKKLTGDLTGMTIGIPKEYFIDGIDEEVAKTVQAAIDKCVELGATIKNISLPLTDYAIATYYIIATAEASTNLARFDGIRYGFRAKNTTDPIDLYKKTKAAGFGEEVKRRIILGTYVLSSGYYDAYYGSAQKARTLIMQEFDKAFEECDAMITPISPVAGYKIGENEGDPLKMYLGDIFTVTANLAGICGLSIPYGKKDDLSIGVQILGPVFKEENILRIGDALEQQ
jgi:aspartyl-tRNA(Asn)/glutamyl-tRNA(Gln) amidotransferase subunit A